MMLHMRHDLPSGTVTLLFTDVEGSTKVLHELGAESYARALAEHRDIVRNAAGEHGGVEVDTQGDAFFVAFPTAPGALAAAAAITDRLATGPIQLRIGVHTGAPLLTDEGYVGEDVHLAARIAATGHGGQVVVSQATRDVAPEFTFADLGEHRLKDIESAVRILQLGAQLFPPLKTISNTNLPRPASSFVGREREAGDIVGRIRGGARLLTLTGPGGSGKTRLAIESASSLVPEFNAGVFWVGLAPVREPDLVLETVGRTLGAKNGLREHIGDRELLLLLDNLEQVIDVAPGLSALVSACPNLSLLVTSRELLRIQGEIEYRVPPLDESEAIRLFCERAQVPATDDIAELCRRLDSLPLAVELAAARMTALSPAQILERLADRLDLLKGGRDADPRQRTLRATIEWSHELLPDNERELFRRLAVFAGGCTLDAAKAVCDAAIDDLQSLVEKSLVRFSDKRYWMLETIREYARERLAECGEEDAYAHEHAKHYARLADALGLAVEAYEAGSVAQYDVAFAEQDNFRTGIDWARARDLELATRIAVALEMFWIARNPAEGVRRFESLLDAGELPLRRRAQVLRGLGGAITFGSGEVEKAVPLYEQSLQLYEQLGDEWGIVHLRHRLATSAARRGDWERCRVMLEENLVRARRLDSRYLESEALSVLGICAQESGDSERGLELMTQSLAITRALGFRWREAIDLANLAEMAVEVGRLDDAEAYGREALALAGEMNDRAVTVHTLGVLSLAAHARGDAERAGRLWGAIEAEEARAPLGDWVLYREQFETTLLADADDMFERGRLQGRLDTLAASVEWALSADDQRVPE
jgi:predicted ATPase